MQDWLDQARELDVELFTLGGVAFSMSSLLKLVLFLAALLWFAGKMRRWTVERALGRSHFDVGARATIGAIVQYLVLGVGSVVVLQNAGINLSALGVLAGAIGVGVGFGLQNIITNFVSGLIIMLERPIKVGDQVQLGGLEGIVESIGARRTTLVTTDGTTVLVPNQRFILENVVNLMYAGRAIRLRLVVPMPAGSDTASLGEVLVGVASRETEVLADPPPEVQRPTLANAQVELCVWHRADIDRQRLASRLNLAIESAFAAGAAPASVGSAAS